MNNQQYQVNLVGKMVKGVRDFKSNREEDLPFTKMERLTIVRHTDDPNYVKARNANGNEGVIPLENVISLHEVKFSTMGWFHGRISREEAEQLLTPREDGFFLVRESTNFPGDYTLCVCFQDKVEHYRVISDKYKKLTIDDDEDFDTLPCLVEHYEKDADGLCTKLRKFAPNKKLHEGRMRQTFSDTGWTIDKDELTMMDTVLGKGEFGDVRLGEFNGQKVAVKTLNDTRVGTSQSILEEACLMTGLNHENLVSFIGIMFLEASIHLVTEYMSKGSLVEYLRTRGRILISKRDQINFACDIANGMVFLESKHYVHRDLAARNVLLHESGTTAKVADFGLTLKVSPSSSFNSSSTSPSPSISPSMEGGGGRRCNSTSASENEKRKFPIKWTAPEALIENIFTNKSDMWSFGVLLWEIYSFGRVPYPKIPLTDVMAYIKNEGRMQEPNDCPAKIAQLLTQAWNIDRDRRPTFEDAHRRLVELQAETPHPIV